MHQNTLRVLARHVTVLSHRSAIPPNVKRSMQPRHQYKLVKDGDLIGFTPSLNPSAKDKTGCDDDQLSTMDTDEEADQGTAFGMTVQTRMVPISTSMVATLTMTNQIKTRMNLAQIGQRR